MRTVYGIYTAKLEPTRVLLPPTQPPLTTAVDTVSCHEPCHARARGQAQLRKAIVLPPGGTLQGFQPPWRAGRHPGTLTYAVTGCTACTDGDVVGGNDCLVTGLWSGLDIDGAAAAVGAHSGSFLGLVLSDGSAGVGQRSGVRSTPRRSWALRATTIVEADISTAPMAGLSVIPAQARTPAASGMAITL
jgi:hypothetical protein